MPDYVDFSWQAEGSRPLSPGELQRWESIIRQAMGGPGWVVMRQVNGVWRVEEARLAVAERGQPGTDPDRRAAVRDALRLHGKVVETS